MTFEEWLRQKGQQAASAMGGVYGQGAPNPQMAHPLQVNEQQKQLVRGITGDQNAMTVQPRAFPQIQQALSPQDEEDQRQLRRGQLEKSGTAEGSYGE